MFCSKCGSEIAEGSTFCGKCGAPVGVQAGGTAPAESAQGAAPGATTPKRSGAKIGAIAAVVVVTVALVVGFATNWFGLAGVQPKEAVEVPTASQGADEAQDANAADSQAADAGESADDAKGGPQAAAGVAVKSAAEAYTWDELSQISAEISAAGDEAAAIEIAKKYNLCTPEGKLDGTQVKSVMLADGTQTTVQIVGFAHDDKTSGGKAGITFIFGDCVGEAPMNSTDTNAGGWEVSQMRAYLNGDWRTQLPQDLATVIVSVDKPTNNVGKTQNSSSVTSTSDSIWLFSLAELVSPLEYSSLHEESFEVGAAEGNQYKLYEDMEVTFESGGSYTNPILVKELDGIASFWYERSACWITEGNFQAVSENGEPNFMGGGAQYPSGVVPGFCI